jgi:hypothetical protein
MRRSVDRIGGALFALIIIVFGSYVIVAQSEVTGDWTATQGQRDAAKIHISFKMRSDKGKHQNGSSFEYSDLEGLQPGHDGPTRFRLAREAGTIEAEGTFTNGKGSGTFRFVPNSAFVSGMRSRGFDFEQTSSKNDSTLEERLFVAAMLNVTTAIADDLRSANFPNLGVDDLFKAAIFKIDGKFMTEMAATGFPNLTMDDLVKARIFKIDAAFVRSIKDMGFGADNFEHLVKYSIFKVTPEYLTELRNEGLSNLTAEEVVKLRIFKVDASFVRDARATDPNITVEQIVQKKIGVWAR